MNAMILAAGAGTRLRPLTDTVPKALVRVGGRTLLDRVLTRVREAGATRIIVNVHHHQNRILAFLRDHAPEDAEIVVSPEPGGPYDTGGGLFAAAPHFRGDAPFILHNVDILSRIPLGELVGRHGDAVASLAVQDRVARRKLLFDDVGLLGWRNRGSDRAAEGERRVRDPVGEVRALAFTGIHVIEPRIFGLTRRRGTFSIIDLYLELAGAGFVLHPLDVTGRPWIDVGTPECLENAERLVAEWDREGEGSA